MAREKSCPRCGIDEPFTEDKSTLDGLSVYCKMCSQDLKRESYERKLAANPNLNKEKYRDRFAKEGAVEKRREQAAKLFKKNWQSAKYRKEYYARRAKYLATPNGQIYLKRCREKKRAKRKAASDAVPVEIKAANQVKRKAAFKRMNSTTFVGSTSSSWSRRQAKNVFMI